MYPETYVIDRRGKIAANSSAPAVGLAGHAAYFDALLGQPKKRNSRKNLAQRRKEQRSQSGGRKILIRFLWFHFLQRTPRLRVVSSAGLLVAEASTGRVLRLAWRGASR